ncbi:MAG: hypothetical protein AAFX50_09770 [Acidobacteriota bacterium]
MLKNAIFYVLLPAAALLLAAPTDANEDTESCWACGAGALCVASDDEGFARDACRETRICTTAGGCYRLCATSSGECAIEDPGPDRPPWWPWNTPEFASTLIMAPGAGAREQISAAFGSVVVGALAAHPLLGQDTSGGSGVLAFDGGASYRFIREVEVSRRGLVTATYVLEGHPAYQMITVESPSRGVDVYVTVHSFVEGQRFEAFSFGE